MRHYFWVHSDGTLGAEHVHIGGFPAEAALHDPGSDHDVVKHIRHAHAHLKLPVHRYVAYDCPCPSAKNWCDCTNKRLHDSIADLTTGKLKPRAAAVVVIDGTPLPFANDMKIDRAPASTFKLKLSCPGVPDGTRIEIHKNRNFPDMAAAYPIVLTFTGGETDEATLVAPERGWSSRLGISHNTHIQRIVLHVRGWAQG